MEGAGFASIENLGDQAASLECEEDKRHRIKKIAITGIEPVGCLPRNTASDSYRNCNAAENNFSQSHNILLKQHISALNYETPGVFKYLDLYTAFISALKIHQNSPG
ncbi:UNVERIFIED_CONTAM: GDSL esterase/lipase [Sesamum radiatum]|uniref:GDSL esterase/lipase n=1 Tax=Sesamum radiatum TaxID=300843 RepID=A0AAW2KCX7_SESRA